jgi:alkaline phosphatase
MLHAGPDGELEWDKLPAIGVYRGHMKDALAASSNGGGTSHAYGVKVATNSFGNDAGQPLLNPDGSPMKSIMIEAQSAGKAIGIVTSASVADAGTGVFLASVRTRKNYTEIARQMLEAKPDVMLGGGESYFLPESVTGRFGKGLRTDGRNLIEEAKAMGYTVVLTRDELRAVPTGTRRVLGLFAATDTFFDDTEEEKAKAGTPYYEETAPTYAEMIEKALEILSQSPTGFFVVAEEEGTDNFAGKMNAKGAMLALKRADDGVGVARRFVASNPRTLVMLAADSDCGGMAVVSEDDMDPTKPLPKADEESGAAWDGRDGTGSLPFIAAPDKAGKRWPFAISWASGSDCAGGILVRGEGYRASELIRGNIDNTRIPAIIREVLMEK